MGSDLNSLPRRRAAAERARDSAKPVLVSDALQSGAGRGLQLFVPVYRKGSPITTVAERRIALTAWVTVVFSAETFLRSAMGGRDAFMDLQVFDGTVEPANLMFARKHFLFTAADNYSLQDPSALLGEIYFSARLRHPFTSEVILAVSPA